MENLNSFIHMRVINIENQKSLYNCLMAGNQLEYNSLRVHI